MKHTPAPWLIIKYTTQGQFVTDTKIVDAEDSYLAKIGPVNIDANARLIAKAPEMFELLRNIANEKSQLVDNEPILKLISEIEDERIT